MMESCMHMSECLQCWVEFPCSMREPPCQNPLAFKISIVKSRNFIPAFPPFSNPSCPNRNTVFLRLTRLIRELNWEKWEGRAGARILQAHCLGMWYTEIMSWYIEKAEQDEVELQDEVAITCAVGQGTFIQNHHFLGIYLCSRPGLLVRIEVQSDTFLSHRVPFRNRECFLLPRERLFSFNLPGQGLIFQEVQSRDTCGKACDSHESPPRRAEHITFMGTRVKSTYRSWRIERNYFGKLSCPKSTRQWQKSHWGQD